MRHHDGYRGVTFVPETKRRKDNGGNFLLDLLIATRETVTNNGFDSIPQRRLDRKKTSDLQSNGMTWRIFWI
jgi:hypothetical protein